jgi:hypothetical protein
MTPDDLDVAYYIDTHGHDCYRICIPGGPCSIVSSAHLIEERKAQLLRMYPQCRPSSPLD